MKCVACGHEYDANPDGCPECGAPSQNDYEIEDAAEAWDANPNVEEDHESTKMAMQAISPEDLQAFIEGQGGKKGKWWKFWKK